MSFPDNFRNNHHYINHKQHYFNDQKEPSSTPQQKLKIKQVAQQSFQSTKLMPPPAKRPRTVKAQPPQPQLISQTPNPVDVSTDINDSLTRMQKTIQSLVKRQRFLNEGYKKLNIEVSNEVSFEMLPHFVNQVTLSEIQKKRLAAFGDQAIIISSTAKLMQSQALKQIDLVLTSQENQNKRMVQELAKLNKSFAVNPVEKKEQPPTASVTPIELVDLFSPVEQPSNLIDFFSLQDT
jgi:hypothetical protein